MPVHESYRNSLALPCGSRNASRRIAALLLVLFLALISCNFYSRAPQETAGPIQEASPAAPTDMPLASPRPPTATSAQTPTPGDPACVPPAVNVQLPPAAYETLPDTILTFLNMGGTPEQLDAGLYAAGVAGLPVPVRSADMTGDGKDEVVVSIFEPGSEAVIPPGKLLIYRCRDGQLELAVERPSAEGNGPPHLWYLQDLDGDGAAELVVSEPSCGAHTCFEDVRVLAWRGAGFENVMEGDTTDLANPDVRISDDDQDGVFDLELAGGGISSVGAGPPREARRIWAFDGTGRWVFETELLGEPVFRIHALHDAEAAARAGDLEEALLLYAQVMEDDSLQDWNDPETERANLSAYAGYKTVVVYTLAEQQRFADLAFETLRETYPPGSPQAPYVTMAEVFLEGYNKGWVMQGCADAIAFAAQNSEAVLEPLGEEVFGYGNPSVAAADMCP